MADPSPSVNPVQSRKGKHHIFRGGCPAPSLQLSRRRELFPLVSLPYLPRAASKLASLKHRCCLSSASQRVPRLRANSAPGQDSPLVSAVSRPRGERKRAEDAGTCRQMAGPDLRSNHPKGMAWVVLEVVVYRPRPEDSLPEALTLGCKRRKVLSCKKKGAAIWYVPP